ncbi:hypothetical protein [Paenibacillus sp. HJGM_3]|uniref:hypothetical protein n=1 Tax=Paenibacillus sp. HJGM_3 TaxID=3379816 RepID=UPI00385C7D7A
MLNLRRADRGDHAFLVRIDLKTDGYTVSEQHNRTEREIEEHSGKTTEETNPHVIELNEKLGYRTVRRGPIWDDVIRVSLIKPLPHLQEEQKEYPND